MGGLDKGDTVKNFLKTLAENNRLGILEGVCEKFSTLMVAERGEVDLIVTSASVRLGSRRPSKLALIYPLHPQKLDPRTLQRLEAAVTKSEYSQGKKLKVVPKVSLPASPPKLV